MFGYDFVAYHRANAAYLQKFAESIQAYEDVLKRCQGDERKRTSRNGFQTTTRTCKNVR